jgi:tetratricopeptide (TPR) repeat protein
MPDSLPPITTAQRQRLQKLWEEARAMMVRARTPPGRKEAEKIHDLLAECVVGDPGNTIYLDALLMNLRQLPPKPRFSIRYFFSKTGPGYHKLLKASSNHDLVKVLSLGPAALRDAGYRSIEILFALSKACQDLDLSQAEVRYLQESLCCMPGELFSVILFRSLMRQGRFDEARKTIEPFRDTVKYLDDLLAVLDGTPPTSVPRKDLFSWSEYQDSATDYLALAVEYAKIGHFDEAEAAAAKALSLSGGDLSVREQVEEISLARLKNNVAIARRLVEHNPSPAHQQTLRRWEEELGRLELATLHARSERFPQDAGLKLEVAVRLKRAGNFSGAIQRLEEIAAEHSLRSHVLTELGECWQHLRQFDKALDFYNQAIHAAEESNQPQSLHLALYRAGSLAAAMHRTAEAKAWLARLVALAPDFKDAGQRLRQLDT